MASTPPYYGGNTLNATLGALSSVLTTQPSPLWLYVRRRFTQLLANLAITDWQLEAGEKSQAGVRACLNRYYYGHSSETANSMLIGSWGKNTRGRPSRDIDILFLLPSDIHWQFQQRVGNRQSQLLQHVKDALLATYPQTSMRQDGQVVVVPFNTIPIEVAPGFRCQDGSIIVCDTNDQGRYKVSTAEAELRELNSSDQAFGGNTRALVRLMKRWQSECNVPLKSFHFERLAIEFMFIWPYRDRDVFYYDWMVRDFLAHLIGRANGWLFMPGTGETVFLGDEWLSRAQTAYRRALDACSHERDSYEMLAGNEWKEIFGSATPVWVS